MEDTRTEIQKATEWVISAWAAIEEAGGVPSHVLGKFTPELLETLIRNDLKLVYKRHIKG